MENHYSATNAYNWPAIAEELPGVTHFANHVEIEIRNDQRIFITRRSQ
jgi:hypothetical protein